MSQKPGLAAGRRIKALRVKLRAWLEWPSEKRTVFRKACVELWPTDSPETAQALVTSGVKMEEVSSSLILVPLSAHLFASLFPLNTDANFFLLQCKYSL